MKGLIRALDRGLERELQYFRLVEAIYPDGDQDILLFTETPEGIRIWRRLDCLHEEFLTVKGNESGSECTDKTSFHEGNVTPTATLDSIHPADQSKAVSRNEGEDRKGERP